MDVKEQIKTAVDRITKDKKLQEQFQKEPVKALESVLGVDLPDDMINQVIDGVKAKLTVDKVSDGFLKCRQPVGQAPVHLPQRMHSGEREISSGASSTGQAFWQAMQEMHLSFSQWICTRLNRLNQP